jgi:uncharacterized membrane protein
MNKRESIIIIVLLLLSAIPCLGGIIRIIDISLSLDLLPINVRINNAPTAAVVHILSSFVFCILGAYQFIKSIRNNHPFLHKVAGRIVVFSGLLAALSGVWLTIFYSFPSSLQGNLLFSVRLVVGFSMASFILLGLSSVLNGHVELHRAWMIRAYALGQGAGTQVLIAIPWFIAAGEPEGFIRDIQMTASWVVNVIFAELFIFKLSRKVRLGRGKALTSMS